MERRDFDYYEARGDVKLEDITSCENNAEILRRLRDQDTYLDAINITDDYGIADDEDNDWFTAGEGDDLGWLGYFIGKSKYLEELFIYSWEGVEHIEALIDGINRNQSIKSLHIGTDLRGTSFQHLRPFFRNNNNLAQLTLDFEVGLECAQSIVLTLGESRCQSLTNLHLIDCNLGAEGFVGIATALRAYPQLRGLYLQNNNIGLMGCIALGDTLRGWGESNLKYLDLDGNAIGDQGLQALATAMTNSTLEQLYLSNNLITAVGLRSLSDYFQSESCCLKSLYLSRINFGDEGAVALAEGLNGNKSLTSLYFDPHQSGITHDGWAAFSKLVCDTSNVNNIYLSNHIIRTIGDHEMFSTPLEIRQFSRAILTLT
ncbi:leucine-rich repeat protein [Skeletonema marinoi]|uniref:Leucine-rich repeat protein n=1 Tax=Skeletonema marinoi TaxID=267567 RepID=A0AAD8XU65_9STRA|nr:leucine-rich repeat protein [Skeletonema marinoi]